MDTLIPKGTITTFEPLMRFSQNAIDEFKAIYQNEFKETLTDDEAQEIGSRVVELLRLLLRPLPKKSRIQTPGYPEPTSSHEKTTVCK